MYYSQEFILVGCKWERMSEFFMIFNSRLLVFLIILYDNFYYEMKSEMESNCKPICSLKIRGILKYWNRSILNNIEQFSIVYILCEYLLYLSLQDCITPVYLYLVEYEVISNGNLKIDTTCDDRIKMLEERSG